MDYIERTIVKIDRAIKARCAAVAVRTSDEAEITEKLVALFEDQGHAFDVWNPVLGLRESEVTDAGPKTGEWEEGFAGAPDAVCKLWLKKLYENQGGAVFSPKAKRWWPTAAKAADDSDLGLDGQKKTLAQIKEQLGLVPVPRTLLMTGLASWLKETSPVFDPLVVPALWEIANFNKRGISYSSLIVVLPQVAKVPDELIDVGIVIDDELPDREHLSEDVWPHFAEEVGQNPAFTDYVKGVKRDHVVDLLTGLTLNRVRTALMYGMVEARSNETGVEGFYRNLQQVKADTLRQSAALEMMDPIPITDIGGLSGLKAWMKMRANALADRDSKIPAPRGILLLGPPGTGKSACAKAAASIFEMPLVRLDVGAIFGGLVGESESNMRKALQTLDAMAPVVVLLD